MPELDPNQPNPTDPNATPGQPNDPATGGDPEGGSPQNDQDPNGGSGGDPNNPQDPNQPEGVEGVSEGLMTQLDELEPDQLSQIPAVQSVVDSRVNQALSKERRANKRATNRLQRQIDELKTSAPSNPDSQPNQTPQGGDPNQPASPDPALTQKLTAVTGERDTFKDQIQIYNDHFDELIEDGLESLPDDVRTDFEEELTDETVNPLKRFQLLTKLQKKFAQAPQQPKPKRLGSPSNPNGQQQTPNQPNDPNNADGESLKAMDVIKNRLEKKPESTEKIDVPAGWQ